MRISPTDKTALLRYSKDESANKIKARLNFPTKLDENDENFFTQTEQRNNMPYLGKVFQNNGGVTLKDEHAKETTLSKIANAMNMSSSGKNLQFFLSLESTKLDLHIE